jgi:ABC-type ATPase with predicted acetyltransferase domain
MRRCFDCGCEVKPGCDVCPDCGSTKIEVVEYKPEQPISSGKKFLIALGIIVILFIIIIFAP